MPCISTPSYEKEGGFMNENLIFEGNTIYELDPICMDQKEHRVERTEKESDFYEQKEEQYSSVSVSSDRNRIIFAAVFLFLCKGCLHL